MFKKALLFLAIFVGIAQYSNAQTTIKGLAGINFSNLTENPEGSKIEGTVGYQVGASVRFGSKFYLEPGFQYASYSRNFSQLIGERSEIEITENWIKVPVYAGLYLLGKPEGDLVALRVFLGPSVAFLGNVDSDEPGFTKAYDLETTRFALDGGVGVDVLFLFAELNYEYGVTNHSNLEGFDASHGSFMINIGAHFTL